MRTQAIAVLIAGAFAFFAGAASGQTADPDARDALFIANKAEGSVSRVRLSDGREERRAPACVTPHELTLSPDKAYVAVGCYDGASLEILRANDLAHVATIRLGDGARPHGVVWHHNGDLFATAEGRHSIYRIRNPLSETRAIEELPTGSDGVHLFVISRDAKTAWATSQSGGSVTRIDLGHAGKVKSEMTGKGTEGIALAPDGAALWVAVRDANQLLELDPATLAVRRTVATGRIPIRVAIHPDGGSVVTSNAMDGSLSVVDAKTGVVERTISVSGTDAALQITLIFDPSGKRLYAAETKFSKIAEIDFATGAVLGRLSGGVGGDGLAIAGTNGD